MQSRLLNNKLYIYIYIYISKILGNIDYREQRQHVESTPTSRQSLNSNNLPVIPVMHCFDENYCLAAAVSFYSMLEHASPEYFYKLYVLHSNNISAHSQAKLQRVVHSFPNASLEFINKGGFYDQLWEEVGNKSHFSKDMFYKLCVAQAFPNYEKMLITDVDVVWRGDIAYEFNLFDTNEDYYIGGYNAPFLHNNCPLTNFMRYYDSKWSKEEQQRLLVGGGFLVYNLKKMRLDNLESKLLEFLQDNVHRLLQPEQDVLNYVCYPKIKLLSKNGMVSTYFWSMFDTEEKLNNATWQRSEIEHAMANPIQIHFAGPHVKPWKVFNTLRSDLWFETLAKTNYLEEWLDCTYKKFDYYKRFYEENKDNEIYPRFNKLISLGFLFELAKRRGIIKIRLLNIKLYIDCSKLRYIFTFKKP